MSPDSAAEEPARIELPLNAGIPEDYIEHLPTRLAVYQRLARLTERRELPEIREELRDRFGPVPDEVENLLKVSEIRAVSTAAGAESVIRGGESIVITLRDAVGGAKAPLQRALGPAAQVGQRPNPDAPPSPGRPVAPASHPHPGADAGVHGQYAPTGRRRTIRVIRRKDAKMILKKLAGLFITALLAASLAACDVEVGNFGVSIGDAPSYAITMYQGQNAVGGETVTLEQVQDKGPLVLYYFDAECENCLYGLRVLQNFYAENPDTPTVLAVYVGRLTGKGGDEDARSLLDEAGATFPRRVHR